MYEGKNVVRDGLWKQLDSHQSNNGRIRLIKIDKSIGSKITGKFIISFSG